MGREVTGHTISQCNLIMEHLTKHGSITQYEAAELYSCWRLASRITDLRCKGVQIKKETLKRKNCYGKTVHYAKYSLEAE